MNYKTKKYTILAGAGVSLDAPANFPIAMQIINSLIKSISADEEIYKLLNTRVKRDDVENEYRLSGSYIRFEMLIDVISLCDPDLKILDAIKEYKTPNLNHYNLAFLAIQGHYIFTPNFDDLIERAICNLGYIPRTICTSEDYNNYQFKDDGTIPVFKLHGSYYKYTGKGNHKKIAKNTIQASLSSIITGNSQLLLPVFKTRVLKKCIKKTSDLLILGYSGGDDFDIVPSLQNIKTKHITWINHSNDINYNNTITEVNLNEDSGRNRLIKAQLTKVSNSVELYNTNTQVFLKEGNINILPKKRNFPHKCCFEDYIMAWREQLSNDEKYYMAGEILFRLCFFQESYRLFDLISDTSIYYIKAQLRCISCLDQISNYQIALRKLSNLKKLPSIDKDEKYLDILEKEAYLIYRISPHNNVSENLFRYVLKNAQSYSSLKQSAINNYALYLRDTDRCHEALCFYKQSMNIAIQRGDLKQWCWTANNLATLLFDEGNFSKSEHICKQGYKRADMIGDYRQISVFENLLANISFIKGEYDSSIILCEKSIERDKHIKNEKDSSVNELLIGQCYFEKGDFKKASLHYDNAQKLFDISDDKYFIYELLFYKTILAIQMKEMDYALSIVEQFNSSSSNIIEIIYKDIANKLIKYFLMNEIVSFKEDLSSFISDTYNKDIVGYINTTYYLLYLKIPIKLVGISHINKAINIYKELENQHRIIFFENINL